MRLFVAVNLPEPVRDDLSQAVTALQDGTLPIRWVGRAGMHVTLKFLGEVADEREPAVTAALDSVCRGVRAFVLPMQGFGVFPSRRAPRIVWAGCDAVPALELLQHGVEREMDALGFPLEGRPFRPHVTLGRVRGRPGAVEGLVERLDDLTFQHEFTVETIDLMQSTLSSAGARYAVRHAVSLDPI